MVSVATTTDLLGEYLREFGATRSSDGSYTVQNGTAMCTVWAAESGPEDIVVHFEAPVILEVPMSDQLVTFAINSNQKASFHSSALITDGNTAVLAFRHALRGAELRKSDVVHAVRYLVEVADLVDEEAQSRFGGRRAADYWT